MVPNAGHLGVADLERDFNVTVVTQNVDNLHERAGSTHVIHLHGELTKVCSSRDPYNPHFVKELAPEEYEVKLGDKAGDGTQLRPFIVWFGESVPEIETAIRYVEQADIFVIIGTSLNVYPAAGLLNYVPRAAEVYLIDPKPADEKSTGKSCWKRPPAKPMRRAPSPSASAYASASASAFSGHEFFVPHKRFIPRIEGRTPRESFIAQSISLMFHVKHPFHFSIRIS